MREHIRLFIVFDIHLNSPVKFLFIRATTSLSPATRFYPAAGPAKS